MTSSLSWLEIDSGALSRNIQAFRKRIGSRKLMAIVKANAYGHGMIPVAEIACQQGADWLGVNSIDEALSLRDHGLTIPILVLGHANPEQLQEAVTRDIDLTLYDSNSLTLLNHAAATTQKPARFHLKVETGLHRQGLREEDFPEFMATLKNCPDLQPVGISTHYANIEDTLEHGYAHGQTQRFINWQTLLHDQGFTSLMSHAACSAGAILFPETHFDMVRVGIGMYGLWSSRETRLSVREGNLPDFNLEPVLSWYARIAQVKTVQAGQPIGYGCTAWATREMRIAIIPIGYAEGYDRGLSGRGIMRIQGTRAPVVGRICMNMTMIDVSHLNQVAAGDTVTLLGGPPRERISADELATLTGTIHYEIVTRIAPHLPRHVVSGPEALARQVKQG